MSLQGDLSTLDLADLFQNLETHRRTGTLAVEGPRGTSHVYFHEGRIALFAAQERASLVDVLVASGTIAAGDLEEARKKRRGRRRSLGEVLVERGMISAEVLTEIANARLVDEVCELVAAGGGEFQFRPGRIPRGVFDPEERRLGLGLPAGPLLLEAARREDHWRLIRERIPSDSTHLVVASRPRRREDEEEEPWRAHLMELLDGTRSVAEAMSSFPHLRFQAYQLLADLHAGGAVRPAGPDDLLKLVRELALGDPERAWTVLGRALATAPHNRGLLGERAKLAELRDDRAAALEARKLLAHLELEAGERERAITHLDRAKELGPSDPVAWKKSFELAANEGRVEDAAEDGRRLAKLFRAPGLHERAAEVFAALVALDEESWEFRRELARSQAACGKTREAVQGLTRYGRKLLGRRDEAGALEVYSEIAAIDPANADARKRIEEIEKGILSRRRETRRRLLHRAILIVAGAAILACAGYDGAARWALADACDQVSERNLIEEGKYAEAARVLEAVRERYPYAPTAWFDVRRRVDELERKRGLTP